MKKLHFQVTKNEGGVHKDYVDSSGNPCTELKYFKEHLPYDSSDKDLFAFSNVEYICYEQDKNLTIKVLRRGLARSAARVHWKTKNRNVSIHSYHAQHGILEFKAGEKDVDFIIDIYPNEEWSTEELLLVELFAPSDGAILGELFVTTVVILNRDCFPHNVDPNEMLLDENGKDTDEFAHSETSILYNFWYHNYVLMKSETHWALIYLLSPGLCWLIETFLVWYAITVESPLGDGPIHSHQPEVLAGMGLAWGCTKMFSNFISDRCASLRLGGKARKNLRTCIVDTTIQLNNESIEKFSTGRVLRIMDHVVDRAVLTGWTDAFKLYAAVVKVSMNFIWVIFLVTASHTGFIMAIPFILGLVDIVILLLSAKRMTRYTGEALEAGAGISESCIEASDLRNLITVYRMGLSKAQAFDKVHGVYNAKNFVANRFKRRAIHATQYGPTLAIVCLFIIAGHDFITGEDNEISVALFVTLISMIKNFESAMNTLFETIFSFTEAVASVKKIATLLNSRTRRKDLYDSAERVNFLVDEAIRSNTIKEDCDQLIVHELEYKYKIGQIVIPSCSFSIEPSLMVAIHSETPFGKNTLMTLLARQQLPMNGFINYPPKWRVRTLTSTPLLLETTLLANLTFGVRCAHTKTEIYTLCEELGLSRDLLQSLEPLDGDEDKSMFVGRGGERLAYTDKILVSIARALLSNVDLLLLIYVLDPIGDAVREKVVAVLRSFIEKRGVLSLKTEYEKTPLVLKKEKIVVCSTRLKSVHSAADYTLTLTPISVVKKTNAKTNEHLSSGPSNGMTQEGLNAFNDEERDFFDTEYTCGSRLKEMLDIGHDEYDGATSISSISSEI